jgi:hypothetical protein
MYDGFSDKGAHSAECFQIANVHSLFLHSACAIGVGIEGCCPSMRYLIKLLNQDLW